MSRCLEDRLLKLWRTQGVASDLLLPLARIYGWLSARHLRATARRAWQAPVPVVVIGNILVGGTGKTPVTLAICQHLQAAGWSPGIVSRGYGARVGAAPRLSRQAGTHQALGDEPALLHRLTGAPVAIHPDRVRAARALLDAHPETDVLLSDDGLQHRALARQVEVIVQDSRGTGNGRLLPAGPLREPPQRLAQADWLVTHLSEGEAQAPPPPLSLDAGQHVTMRLRPRWAERLADGRRQPWADWLACHAQQPCSAAAGIAHPERFFELLRREGLTLERTVRLPDHGHLSPATLRRLPNAPVLITGKDAVKYATGQPDPRLWLVHAAATFSDDTWLDRLQQRLAGLRAAHDPAHAPTPPPGEPDLH